MSIIEMLIAATLTLGLIVLIGEVLGPAMRYTSEGSIRVELQQSASLALNSMIADMQCTTAPGVSLVVPATANDPAVLAVDRIYDIDGGGFPEYESSLQVYYSNPSAGTLQKKTWPPAPPAVSLTFNQGAPAAADTVLLNSIISQVNNSERMLAHYVTSYKVTNPSAGLYRIVLNLQQDVPNTQRRVDIQFTRQILLRNTSSS